MFNLLASISEIWQSVVNWVSANLILAIAIAAGVVVLIVALIVILVVVKKKKKNRAKEALRAEDERDKKMEQVQTQEVEPVKEEQAQAEELEPVKEQAPVIEEKVNQPVVEEVEPVKQPEPTKPAPKKIISVKASTKTVNKVAKPVQKTEEKVAPKATAKVAEKKVEEVKKPATKKAAGKWTVEIKSENEYMSKLYANNGECMLSSEIYASEEGARNGIETLKNAVVNGKFVTYRDKSGNYYFKLKTSGNRLLCVGEIYKSLDQCLRAVESVKRLADISPVIDDLVQGQRYIDYTPIKNPVYDVKKGTLGKWIVEETADKKYSAKLFASNGQLMLATEEVSTKKTAENAMLSVKKNSAAGNFIVDKDKFGRFYYKLRNAQKSMICIGEAYDTLDSCTSALESVRRFAATAVYDTETE